MTFEIAFTLAVVAALVALFVWERFPTELVALLGLGAVVAGGVISAEEALVGFSNPAALTIAGMFVLSSALERTGAISELTGRLRKLPLRGNRRILAVALPVVVVLSAFLNNTPVVALFVPLLLGMARRFHASPSRLLMPLSFAAMLGGCCTLIGTSTNLLVSQIMAEHGMAPLGMFEIGAVGLPLALVGLVYLLWIAPRLLPARSGMLESVPLSRREFLSEVVIREGSPLVGQRLLSSAVARIEGVSVLDVIRGGEVQLDPLATIELQVGDRLIITATPDELRSVQELNGVEFGLPGLGVELVAPHESIVVEGIVAPNSRLLGKKIGDLGLRQQYGLAVLAVHRHAANLVGRLHELRVTFGDILLMLGTRESVNRLRRADQFIVLDDRHARPHQKRRLPLALAVMALVVILGASGLISISSIVLFACVVLVLGGCLEPGEAYRAVEWNIILLIVGTLGIGLAVERSGAADYVAHLVLEPLADYGPTAVLSGVFLLSTVVTAFLSNSAAAVLLTPIAISAGAALGIDPRPLAIAVALGCSAAFATPIGYQTNLLVYGAGGYRFGDFLRAGLPLILISWAVVTWIVPRIWPLLPAG